VSEVSQRAGRVVSGVKQKGAAIAAPLKYDGLSLLLGLFIAGSAD